MTTQNPSDRKYDRPPQGGRGGGPRATMRLVEKPKDFKGAMNKLLKYLKPYWFLLLVSVIFSVASTVFNILSPKQMGLITTELYVGMTQKNGRIDFNYIGRIILILLLLYIGYTLFHVIQGLISNTVSQKIGYEMRKSMADKCNRLPLSYFDTNLHGDILSRLTNDIDTITMTLNQSLSQITTTVTQILGVFIMMLLISPLMTAVAVLILPLSSVFVAVLVKKSQKFFKAQQENLGNLNGHVEEMFSGHLVLKVFNGEERSVDKFRAFNDKLFESSRKSQFLSGLMFPVTGFIGDIGYVAICVLGGYLVLSNSIQVGDIQAFIRYVRQFNNPLRQTAGIANTLQSTAAAAERVFEFLEETEEIPDPENTYNISDFKGNVSFKNVFFGYDKNVSIIKDFTVDVKAGQKIAIVGPTGAGKTTLVNLLMRFYDVDSGSISIDGVDIRDMKRSDLRNLFGMVLQDTWLFNGTLRENIAYPDSDADFEDIQKSRHCMPSISYCPEVTDMT